MLLGLAVLATGNEGGSVARTRMMKLAFLLAKENAGLPPRLTYDFVPYKYGPFSFRLYHDVSDLAGRGLLRITGEQELMVPERSTRPAREEFGRAPRALRDGVYGILNAYGTMPTSEILNDVYRRYPWYATRSVVKADSADRARQSPEAPIAIYTCGYQGNSVDGFFDLLLRTGVRRIIDVRMVAASRKYGFARSSMSRIASNLDVGYVHMPQLGIPSSERKNIGLPGARQRLLDRYERALLPKHQAAVAKVAQQLSDLPSVLVCVEADPEECHRGRLAKVIGRRTGLPIRHL
jgi:hypothetical protein